MVRRQKLTSSNGNSNILILDNSFGGKNDKSQQEASVRRFMKKIVARIIKRVYLMLSTTRVDPLKYKDFSEYNVIQIMEEKLQNESSKKQKSGNVIFNSN
jgi:hypothetical protein